MWQNTSAPRGNEWAPALVHLLLGVAVDDGAKDSFCWCALHYAATAGHTGGVGALLISGADVMAADRDGNTPPHTAVGFR